MYSYPSDRVDDLLRLHDVPVIETVYVDSAAAAEAAFEESGFRRAVLKAGGLLHKTDKGGVVLGLESGAEARAAAERLVADIGQEAFPLAVQQQASGFEVLVGVRREPGLGTVVVVGHGGVHSEIHRDLSRRLLPVSTDDVHSMLAELRCLPLLTGYRGAAPHDVDALVRLIIRVTEVAEANPEIVEMDLNPVLVGEKGDGCVVVDARVIAAELEANGERHEPIHLDRLMQPKQVAVVGVSDDPSKTGSRIFHNLRRHAFGGSAVPVHPSGGEIDGVRRYSSIADIPTPIDLVSVAVPEPAVLDVVTDAAAAGVGGVIVHTSGFASSDEAGADRQREVARVLAEAGVPLLGPNSMGMMDPSRGLVACTSDALGANEFPAGSVGLVTGSGALGSCVGSRMQDVGLSRWVHVGNEGGVRVADVLDWFARDDDTSVAALLLEGITDGPELVAAGRAMAARGKPVFAFDLVRSEASKQTALSHTGAMVGSLEVRAELLRAACITSVSSLQTLEDAVTLATGFRLPKGRRLAAVSMSGGACSIIADEATAAGLELPALSERDRDRIAAMIPAYGSTTNPIDAGFMADEDFGKLLGILAESPDYDAVLVGFTTNADPSAVTYARAVIDHQQASIPVYVSRFGHPRLAPEAVGAYRSAGIPVLDAPDRAVRAIAAVMHAATAGAAHQG